MASKRLNRFGFNQKVIQRLKRHNVLLCKDVLSKSQMELQNVLGLGDEVIKDLFKIASRACAPKCRSGLELLKDQMKISAFLSTSLSDLDKVLHGGLPAATITEIAGPSGCGKTQMCMMLALLSILPRELGGLDGAAIYIDTESTFSAERLVEMAEGRFAGYYDCEEKLEALLSQVHVYQEDTTEALSRRLETLEEELIRKGASLVIVDSIASLVRKEFDPRGVRNMTARSNLLAKQATILKYIAENFNIPVVVTNQITTRYGSSRVNFKDPDLDASVHEKEVVDAAEGGYVTAALGNTWSHCVNTRLILQYLHGPLRQILVAKSPVAPFAAFVYSIDRTGIQLQAGGAERYDGTDPGLQSICVRSSLPHAAFSI